MPSGRLRGGLLLGGLLAAGLGGALLLGAALRGRGLRGVAFRLARTDALGWLVRLAFAYGSPIIPVRRITETPDLIAFHHPVPSWRPHILLIPKHPIPSLMRLRPDRAYLFGLIVRAAFEVAAARALSDSGFAVLVNGGAYQDVGQLHVHLAGLDAGLTYAPPRDRPE
jgi:histidine triad (HIT) family protein